MEIEIGFKWHKYDFNVYWHVIIKKYPGIKDIIPVKLVLTKLILKKRFLHKGHNPSQTRLNRVDFKEKIPPQSPTAFSDLIDWPFDKTIITSNRPEVFCEKGVLKNLAIFTRKHIGWSLFLIKLVVVFVSCVLRWIGICICLLKFGATVKRKTFFVDFFS